MSRWDEDLIEDEEEKCPETGGEHEFIEHIGGGVYACRCGKTSDGW